MYYGGKSEQVYIQHSSPLLDNAYIINSRVRIYQLNTQFKELLNKFIRSKLSANMHMHFKNKKTIYSKASNFAKYLWNQNLLVICGSTQCVLNNNNWMQQFKRNGAFDQAAHYKIKYMGRILNLKSAVIPPPPPIIMKLSELTGNMRPK